MNMNALESLVISRLRKALPKEVRVAQGPYAPPVLGGMRPEVYVHAALYEDSEGVTVEGARIARKPLSGPAGTRGFVEQRPGLITVIVTCVSASLKTVQALAGVISPNVLLALESVREIPLGVNEGNVPDLWFGDLAPHQHSTAVERDRIEDIGFYLSRMVFHLDGFLRVEMNITKGPRSSKTAGKPSGLTAGRAQKPKKRVTGRKART